MKGKSSGFFWPSFTDLMTSLFFIMLVLYVLTFAMLKIKENELTVKLEDYKRKLEVYQLVEQNLKPLKENSKLFKYEKEYKRFSLAFDVNFEVGQYEIALGKLRDFSNTETKIHEVGLQLQSVIDTLAYHKLNDTSMNDVSYLLIISGYASQLAAGNQLTDYELSYKRAYFLWDYWKKLGIDFESEKYEGLIDLQIAGNGWGGVGRYLRDEPYFLNERLNQRFIIQIVPKISNSEIQ